MQEEAAKQVAHAASLEEQFPASASSPPPKAPQSLSGKSGTSAGKKGGGLQALTRAEPAIIPAYEADPIIGAARKVSSPVQSLIEKGEAVSMWRERFMRRKHEPVFMDPVNMANVVRETRLVRVPESKFGLLRVERTLEIQSQGEHVLHEVAMVADHCIVRSDVDPGHAAEPAGKGYWKVPVTRNGDHLHEVVAALEAKGYVAAPNHLHFPTDTTPDDPRYSDLWGMDMIGAPKAWDIQTGSSDVLVGVIDTGVDANHPDLLSNIWTNPGESGGGRENNNIDDDGNGYVDDVNGWDFFSDDNDPFDTDSHGTHCAGTVAGSGNNGVGVAGVSWQAGIVPLRFLGPDGGSSLDGARAIDYATSLGVKITNNSWGGGGYNEVLRTAISDANDQGALFVAAAGNSGINIDLIPSFPAGYELPNIVSVAAIDDEQALAEFEFQGFVVGASNYGSIGVDLAAPGKRIWSTTPGDSYAAFQGTSMAAPHVAGAAALLWAAFPEDTNLEIRQRILDTAQPLASLSGKCATGAMLYIGDAFGDGTAPTPPSYRPAALAAGRDHFLVLNQDGTVVQWGAGLPVAETVSGLTDVVQVAAGNRGTTGFGASWKVALMGDGTVQQWTGTAPLEVIPGMTDIVEISLGYGQLLARRSDGTVWTVGESYLEAGMGDGVSTSSDTAIQVSGVTDAIALGGGMAHHMVLLNDGTVVSWGLNNDGQLGDGTTDDRLTPAPVLGLSDVVSIASGKGTLLLLNGITGAHSLAARSDGSVWAWGYNRNGELGKPFPARQSVPTMIEGLENIRKVTAGKWVSFAIDDSGDLFGFGWNGFGNLGLGDVIEPNAPEKVEALSGVIDVAAGDLRGAALLGDGSVWAWGSATGGALGNGIRPEQTFRPVDPGLENIRDISSGYSVTSVIDDEGYVWQTGSSLNDDLYNPLITGATTLNVPTKTSYNGVQSAPGRVNNREYELMENGVVRLAGTDTTVPGLPAAKVLSTRGWSGSAIAMDDQLWTWGQSSRGNDQGQLGDGTLTNRVDALPVSGLPPVADVAMGNFHAIAATTSGAVFTWGSGSSGKLGHGNDDNSLVPVQVSGLSDVIQVGAGDNHSLARTSDGTVYSWGSPSYNGHGASNDQPVALDLPEAIVDVSAGYRHSLAVGQSGKIYAWGSNSSAQLGDGTAVQSSEPVEVELISTAVKASAGLDSSVALLSDGSIRVWGSNRIGQVGDGNSRQESPVLVISPLVGAAIETLSFAADSTLNWHVQYFSSSDLKDPLVSGNEADPDGDRINNFMEYALGTDPMTPDDHAGLLNWSLQFESEEYQTQGAASGGETGAFYFSVDINRITARPDTVFGLELTEDLEGEDWSGVDNFVKLVETPNLVKLRARAPASETMKLFGRLVVE